MRIPKKWLGNTTFRGILSDIGFRFNNHMDESEFEPWFQYKIGPYEKGYTLYFPKQPNKQRYKNGIFLKMKEYSGSDLTHFLDYHYAAYPDKKGFVRFLRYEILEKLKLDISKPYRLNLEGAFEWVKEKEEEARMANHAPTSGLPEAVSLTNGLSNDDQAVDSSLPAYQKKIFSKIEADMNDLTRSYSGKIVLNNKHHTEKLIQVLILIGDLKVPGKKAEQLFQHFSAMDLAAILRQVEEFGDQRTNTLQLKISAAKNDLDLNDPKVEKLTKALTDFFYH
ncbi:MAG TPA: hypothetical protein VF939_01330 [Puia sp.]